MSRYKENKVIEKLDIISNLCKKPDECYPMIKKAMLFIFLIFHFLAFPHFACAEPNSQINIAIKEFPPFIFKELRGFCIDLAEVICKENNLTPKFVRYDSVPELLDAVESQECHIGFSGITITADREKRVDFSQPFFDSGLSVAVRTKEASGVTSLYQAVLRLVGYSVILFFIALTIVAHIIWIIEKDDNDPKSFSTHYTRGILGAYWWSVVTMTTVGYGDKCPKKISGRIIASIWIITGIMWFAGFTATLSSALTVTRIEHAGIKGLSDLNNKHVAVIRGTTSENYLRFHNVQILLADNLDDLISMLKNQSADAVVYDAPALMYISKNDPSIKVVGEMFDKQRYGIVFPQTGILITKNYLTSPLSVCKKQGSTRKFITNGFNLKPTPNSLLLDEQDKKILVSIIIPTYNRGWIIKEAIDSVLAQSFDDYELIVVDDGSIDNTPDLLAAYAERIIYIQQKNRGVSAARNAGIRASRGSLIAFLDSDDYWLPDKLAIQSAFFDSNRKVKICQTEEIWVRNGVRVNPKKKHAKPSGDIFERSLSLCLVSPSAVMLRRELFDDVGLFDETLPACEDYDMWLRISCRYPVHLIDKALIIKNGGHPDQLSRQPGLDKYRIRSLLGIIQSGRLSRTQLSQATKMLDEKCTIYAAGCRKRGKEDEAVYYERLADMQPLHHPLNLGQLFLKPLSDIGRGILSS